MWLKNPICSCSVTRFGGVGPGDTAAETLGMVVGIHRVEKGVSRKAARVRGRRKVVRRREFWGEGGTAVGGWREEERALE